MKNLILLLLLMPVFAFAQPGYITTIAGNGTDGFSGDGGAATAAEMGQALGVGVDGNGNIYIPDDDNSRIRKVTPTGIITTIAGGGSSTADGIPATNASINLSSATGAITLDIYGNVYFSESNRVRKITIATGIITTIAGAISGGFSGDNGPATAALLSRIQGVYLDVSGNLYIGDEGNSRVRMVNTAGTITTIAGTGTAGFSGDGGPATAAQLNYPDGICIDAAGNLYIGDELNYRIRKIDPTGIITTYAGSGSSGFSGDGGPATAAKFYEPSNVCMDSYGNLYIADFHNSRVRKVTPAGIISTFAGGGSSLSSGIPATSASFSDVWGIGIDNYDNIYVADRNHYRICKVGVGFPTEISDSFSVVVSSNCAGLDFEVISNAYSAGQHVTTYFGNGSSLDTTFAVYGSRGVTTFYRPYLTGTYSIKHVLYDGTAAVDSITYTQNFSACQNFTVKYYYDANGNCIKDTSEPYFFQNIETEIDSSGIPIDTVASASGFYYLAYGSSGSVYSFKVLSTPAGVNVSCPVSGIINDTMLTGVQPIKYVGLICNTSTSFDLAVNAVVPVTGVNDEWGNIYVRNNYCMPTNGTLTLHYSPKYAGTPNQITPAATSVSGNTIVWNLNSLTSESGAPVNIHYSIWKGSTPLTVADTVNSYYEITPIVGDVDTTNNNVVVIDTVRAGCDPNEMSVSPAGCIPDTGITQLQYTISFMNVGNDTAFNIYAMDTLSANVDPKSLQIVMASNTMNVAVFNDGTNNIVKFDFPGIDLLDSTACPQCSGAVIFNIKTLPGLSAGTTILNHAGVFFDYNPVVMTNTVENTIGNCTMATTGIPAISNNSHVEIFPNPTTSSLTIKTDACAYNSCTITNTVGQQLIQQPLNGTQTQVNVQMLPPGLYYITVKGDNGSVVRKFVKE